MTNKNKKVQEWKTTALALFEQKLSIMSTCLNKAKKNRKLASNNYKNLKHDYREVKKLLRTFRSKESRKREEYVLCQRSIETMKSHIHISSTNLHILRFNEYHLKKSYAYLKKAYDSLRSNRSKAIFVRIKSVEDAQHYVEQCDKKFPLLDSVMVEKKA